jgi:homoserine kinase type II
MALRTPLDSDEARTVCDRYGLVLESIEPLASRGTVNSNFRLRASGRVYFLRLNEGKRDEDVASEIALVDHLRARGLSTPEILRTRDGEAIVAAAGKPATLFPWLDGHEAAPRTDKLETVALVGTTLARLHRAGWGMKPDELPRNHYSLDELERRLESFANDRRVSEVVTPLRYELIRARRRRSTVNGLIHQDLFPDNVLVDGAGELVAVLDFEQATWGALIYDLAVCLNAWCWTGTRIDKLAADVVVAAYEKLRPIDMTERARLVDEARLAAARFAITRITDIELADGVDPDLRRRKDYREYIRRLEYWVEQG